MSTAELIAHIEDHVGSIAQGWGPPESTGLQVVLIREAPSRGLISLLSLGLSNHVLRMTEERTVRQELLFVTDAREPLERLAALILKVSEICVRTHKALLRGQILNISEPVILGGLLTHLYICAPFFLTEGARTLETTDPPTILTWLIPITQAEAHFIDEYGWNTFEDKLEALGDAVDLLDLHRSSIANLSL